MKKFDVYDSKRKLVKKDVEDSQARKMLEDGKETGAMFLVDAGINPPRRMGYWLKNDLMSCK